jgi:bifunctional non-homologous end joining protein LigD
MISRNGLDWTSRFKKIAEAVCHLPIEKGILDGEVVVFREDGTTDFNALQNYVEGKPAALSYVVYDLPHYEGYDLTRTPLIDRKRCLEKLVTGKAVPLGDPAVDFQNEWTDIFSLIGTD